MVDDDKRCWQYEGEGGSDRYNLVDNVYTKIVHTKIYRCHWDIINLPSLKLYYIYKFNENIAQ